MEEFDQLVVHLKAVHNTPECFSTIDGCEDDVRALHASWHAQDDGQVHGNFSTVVRDHKVTDLTL